MKKTTIPSLQVDLKLHGAAKDVQHGREGRSGYVTQTIRRSIIDREARQAFLTCGLLARDRAAQTGHYVDSSAVIDRLQGMLDKAKYGGSAG